MDQEDKIIFLKQKIYNKGLDYNPYLLNYFSESLSSRADGSKSAVESELDKNLTSLNKSINEVKLNNHGFMRNKPFLMHKKVDLVYPNVIPLKNPISDYELKYM